MRRRSGQAKNEVGRQGSHFRTNITIDIETEPDESPDAAEADLFGCQASGVAGGNASHFGEIVHGAEFEIVGMGCLTHDVELAGNPFASRYAGLSAAIENFFDRVQSRVVDAFSKSRIERIGRCDVVERQHLKRFEDGKRDAAERLQGGEIERRGDGTSPLQS